MASADAELGWVEAAFRKEMEQGEETRHWRVSRPGILVKQSNAGNKLKSEFIKHKIYITHLHLLRMKLPCIQRIMTNAKQEC